jgi:hypothetical protein
MDSIIRTSVHGQRAATASSGGTKRVQD